MYKKGRPSRSVVNRQGVAADAAAGGWNVGKEETWEIPICVFGPLYSPKFGNAVHIRTSGA